MNKCMIIGRLTADPILRTVKVGTVDTKVANFSVAVNTKTHAGTEKVDYFRVTAWRGLGESCAKYLTKGRRVAVTGRVGINTYSANNKLYSELTISADEVEFLDLPMGAQQGTSEAAPEVEEIDGDELLGL